MSEATRIPCPSCGEMIVETAQLCRFCGVQLGPGGQMMPPPARGDATGGLIPYKNAQALIAYYCGVFSIIPCFIIGIVALVLGIRGLKFAKQHPEAKGRAHAWIGILAGGFFGIVYLIVTILGIVSAVAA